MRTRVHSFCTVLFPPLLLKSKRCTDFVLSLSLALLSRNDIRYALVSVGLSEKQKQLPACPLSFDLVLAGTFWLITAKSPRINPSSVSFSLKAQGIWHVFLRTEGQDMVMAQTFALTVRIKSSVRFSSLLLVQDKKLINALSDFSQSSWTWVWHYRPIIRHRICSCFSMKLTVAQI